MKRLVTSLLLIPLLAFGASRPRPPAPQPASAPLYTIEEYDSKDGKLLARHSDSSGQSGASAAGATVADSGAKKVAEMLASRWDGVTPAGYISTRRAAIDQPDVALEQSLQNDHKAAVAGYQAAVAAGASGNALTALMKTIDGISNQIADVRKAKAQAPKPDSSVLDFDALIIGADAPATIALLGDNGVKALAATAGRSTFTNEQTEKQTDTTKPEDWEGAGGILETVARMKEVDLKIAELNKAISDARPAPVVKPPETKPDADPVTPEQPGTGLSDEEAKKIISGLQFLDGTDRNHPQVLRLVKMYGSRITHFGGGNESNRAPDGSNLWKPDSDNDGNLVVITSSTVKAGSVTVGGETVSKMSIGNGWRPHFRFGKPGAGGYGSAPKVVVEGVGSATITTPGKKQTFKLTGSVTPPADAPAPGTSSLFILEPDKLTLRPDFANAVTKIDAVANITEVSPGKLAPGYVVVPSGKVGPYTWGIPKPLGSYPKGALPNTWRIRLDPDKGIPADVTYHRSINQTFIREGATTTYPPTTRE